MIERRQNQRYKMKNNPLIIHFYKIGNIENISEGGLCCTCINDEFDPCSHNIIDIRCHRGACRLQNLGIKILVTKVSRNKSFSGFFMRKCHIKFEKFSDFEIKKLSNFISDNAAEEITQAIFQN